MCVKKGVAEGTKICFLPVHRSTAEDDRQQLVLPPSGAQAKPRRKVHLPQLPCHLCPFTNSHVNYLQRQEFLQFVHVSNSSKNGWFFRYTILCGSAVKLGLSTSLALSATIILHYQSISLKLSVFCQSTVTLFLAQANRNQTDS